MNVDFVVILQNNPQSFLSEPPYKLFTHIEVLIDPYITMEEYAFEVLTEEIYKMKMYPWSNKKEVEMTKFHLFDKDKYYLVKSAETQQYGIYNMEQNQFIAFRDQELVKYKIYEFFYHQTCYEYL